MRNLRNVKHIKLVTGDEIICELVEDDERDIVVRNALKMVSQMRDGYKFYTFKNFMIYQDRPDQLQIIRAMHVVSYAVPPEDLIAEWEIGLNEMFANSTDKQQLPEEFVPMMDSDSGSNVVPFKPIVH